MHARWMAEVLGPGDSLFTPGSKIWTAEHLDELARDFIGQPDLTKGKNFLEKLHDQMAHVSPEAIQLMSELHAVHFLIISNIAISALKKRSDLEAIVSWMPIPCAVPDDVLAAMAPGLVHPGQWVMTRRDTQLTWLIRFSRAWKDLPGPRQHELIADPWALKAFSETIKALSSDSARLALLHLAHPDAFEAIVSPGHRRLIAERFADADGSDLDLDRQLLAIRTALAPQYGERFDWYSDPLVHRWLKDPKAWPSFVGWLQQFRASPEFGEQRGSVSEQASKVREARDLALAADDGWPEALQRAFTGPANNLAPVTPSYESLLSWLAGDRDAGLAALMALWKGADDPVSRIRTFLEFVPATLLGSTDDRLNLAAFLLAGEEAASLPPVRISALRRAWALAGWGRDAHDLDPSQAYSRELVFLDELVRDSAAREHPLTDRLDAQVALSAMLDDKTKPSNWPNDRWQALVTYRDSVPSEHEPDPGSDDEKSAVDGTEVIQLVDHIANAANSLHVDRAVLDEIVELLEDKRQVVLYGPPGTGKTFLALKLARAITEGDESRMSVVQFHPATSYEDFFEGLRPKVTSAGQVTYERTDGPLAAIAAKAAVDSEQQYVLVIDEINRANLPKVLGELLFLLEYRTESARTLYRPEQPFRLPGNLWFIGTMNTADRSVALIDAAMRRRFHFVPFFPHDGPMKGLLRRWLADGGGRAGVADFLDAVNNELLGLVGEHLLVGPSHFMKTDLSDRALDRIWTYNVFPLIEEQLWGNLDEIARWRWASVRERFAHALTGSSPAESDQSSILGGADGELQPS
jgi:5-methylcytosine-specific restriction enzyme B